MQSPADTSTLSVDTSNWYKTDVWNSPLCLLYVYESDAFSVINILYGRNLLTTLEPSHPEVSYWSKITIFMWQSQRQYAICRIILSSAVSPFFVVRQICRRWWCQSAWKFARWYSCVPDNASPLSVAMSLEVSKCRVKKGFGWTIFGLSDTDFYHLPANISKTLSHSVTCQIELNISSMRAF